VVVDVEWSGISTGTERLLWSGRMPPFPGMGYPLVPGYESVGRVSPPPAGSVARIGERLRSGRRAASARCAACSAAPPRAWSCRPPRACRDRERLGDAASCWPWRRPPSCDRGPGRAMPDLIVGHGVLGRLLARLDRGCRRRRRPWCGSAIRRA
jgi:3-hydroxyethyl bacteriochlorophyllide a dehydrogenase